MSCSSFEFNVRPNIHYRVQIWTLNRPIYIYTYISKPFCNIFLFSKALNDFSVKNWDPGKCSDDKDRPVQTMTVTSSMLHCGRDAFIIIFLNIFLKTPLWTITMHLRVIS